MKEEDIDDLEDDLDDEFMRQYQQQRKQELLAQAMKPKFGYVMEINKDDYVREVTEGSKGKSFNSISHIIFNIKTIILQHSI